MRVFLGTAELGGYYARLVGGFAELGVEAVSVPLVSNPLGYSGERPGSPLLRLVALTAGLRCRAVAQPRAIRLLWRLLQEPLRPALLAWALLRFDVVVLSFGTSVAGPWELPLLRLLGKRVVHVFHGSDTRPPYLDGFIAQSGTSPRRMRRLTRRSVRRLRWIERWSTAIVCHPASAQLHRRPFLAYLEIGIPVEPRVSGRTGALREPGCPVRALHSPSNPGVKGTVAIRTAVAEAKRRGARIELVEITGRPNAEVLTALADCDLAIDQAYSDQPLAGFAAEAAAAGVPTVVGGYAAGDPGAPLPSPPPPSAFVHPDRLADTIHRLASDEVARRELGLAAQALVCGSWTPAAVAQRVLAAAAGAAPPDWLVDPACITYPLGCGLAEADVHRIVGALVARYGPSALYVDDKPELRARLLALAAAADGGASADGPARPPR